jgi:hypothetical protein
MGSVAYPKGDDPVCWRRKSSVEGAFPEMSTETIKKTKAPAKPRKTTAKAKTKTLTEAVETALPAIAVPSHDEIAILAERFWIERGCQDGGADQDWLRAEAQLLARAS